MENTFALRGNVCHTPKLGEIEIRKNAFVVCEDGVCRGIFDALPDSLSGIQVYDCADRLILPGLIDMHTHAPQYAYVGTGMDYELMEWLEKKAFPEEAMYADAEYARRAYGIFAETMKRSATTRAVVFGTIHADATLILAGAMEKCGLVSYVGKVNMDRNASPELTEDTGRSLEETRRFVEAYAGRGFTNTKPILTPRFVPCCSDALMEGLGKLCGEYGLPVQSHLSENPLEIDFVRKLCPWSAFYGDAYDRFGLFGTRSNTVMAHCVYSSEAEIERIRDNGVWIAHCPSSNMNIASGIAPVRKYLEAGLRIGLGTDVAGGSSPSMFRAVTDAIQVSKLYWRCVDQGAKPLTFPEALYLATKGGGAFFGRAGSFEEGYAFDALVLDDSVSPCARRLSLRDRLERAFYLGLDREGILMKFADGRQVL